VGELVADDGADGAVVGRFIAVAEVEGRLQDSGGEVDVVLGRVVVGVDGGGRHTPFGFVDGLADAAEVAVEVEGGDAGGVADEVAADDADGE